MDIKAVEDQREIQNRGGQKAPVKQYVSCITDLQWQENIFIAIQLMSFGYNLTTFIAFKKSIEYIFFVIFVISHKLRP